MKTNVIDYEKIKQQIPRGAMTDIARQASVTVNTVSMVLKGKSKNMAVLKAIASYLEEQADATRKIASLIN